MDNPEGDSPPKDAIITVGPDGHSMVTVVDKPSGGLFEEVKNEFKLNRRVTPDKTSAGYPTEAEVNAALEANKNSGSPIKVEDLTNPNSQPTIGIGPEIKK